MSTHTFSHRVKAEAAGKISGRKKCGACLCGMILFARELGGEMVTLQTENKDVRDLFIKLGEHIIGEGGVAVTRQKRSNRPELYTLKIRGEENLKKIFSAAGIAPPVFDENGERTLLCAEVSENLFGSFAAGVFLCCGSVVEPVKGYHLEFVTPSRRLCEELGEMLSLRLGVRGGIMRRGTGFILYFKESEQIEDILTLIGASKSSIELMNVKIYKDIRNRANRATNCDTANLGRQSRSAQRQIEAIKYIDGAVGLNTLPPELSEVARVRLENPEMSLSEMQEALNPPLSRSGVNHRLQRLIEMAEELKNG